MSEDPMVSAAQEVATADQLRADLDDHTNPDRLALLDTTTRQRLLDKYRKARAALG